MSIEMNNQIENFTNYLLDTETTSEIVFIENIHKNDELFQLHYLKDWELMVLRKLEQVHRNGVRHTLTNVDSSQNSQDNSSKASSTSSSTSDDDDDDDDDKQKQNTTVTSTQYQQKNRSRDLRYVYVDLTSQCQRLLRILYHCQQKYSYFVDLYYHAIEQFLKSADDEIVTVVYKQIATHIFESKNTDGEYQRLVPHLPFDILSSSVPSVHQPILSMIQTLLSTDKAETNTANFLANYLDILYTSTDRFLDVRKQFRDTTSYFIDGDSLLLSIAHHTNVNLDSYNGNTLHIIFIIERILITLFQQSNECNFTLLFFDCHYHVYEKENTILSLIRSCLISHLANNASKHRNLKIKRFSSWLSDEYLKFAQDETPLFLFYHDLSTLDKENNRLLSQDTLEKLYSLYRLFSIYHQYVIQCELYLMNKLILTETAVTCFQIKYDRMCPKNLIEQLINILSPNSHVNGIHERDCTQLEILSHDISENDIRLFLYLKTIMDLIEENRYQFTFQYFATLLLHHVALLIRLSLSDRHLPSSIPSLTYSTTLSQYITEFQQRLSFNVDSHVSKQSYSKIADLFDGRLFTFTLCQIHQSSNISFDSNTRAIVEKSLKYLNLPYFENTIQSAVQELSLSNHITFSSLLSENRSTVTENSSRKPIIQISNPLIDAFLDPIISSSQTLGLDLIQPDESHVIQSPGKNYWQTYFEAGNEIDRIRDKQYDKQQKINHRYRTKNEQKLFDFYNLYGRSLTTRDVRDTQVQIVLPTASTPEITDTENSQDQSNSASRGISKKNVQKRPPKTPQLSKGEVIIQQNNLRKQAKLLEEETEKLNKIQTQLGKISSDDYSQAINIIDECLIDFQTTTMRLNLFQRKLDLQRKHLRTLKRKNNRTLEENSTLELLQIGYFATLCETTHLENITDAFNDKKKYMEELVGDLPLDKEKWYRFQLEKVNSRLPKRERGKPDERIPEFIPDQWQVQFLNAVDNKQSIVIVAPTASGKTYASYYAMQKIIKNKDDPNGMCVYIAPSKALINQVAGTIHSKFGAVFGILTQEYEMNVRQCQILVTSPDCFEMLLLSPQYQKLCQRFRYCIFDEIHCMSTDIGSDSWERSILLINCPMIGLSATVNNGESLKQWLENIEKQRSKLFKTPTSREVSFIINLERVADLNKYLYSNRQLYPLHPIGLLNSKQLTARGLPKDLSLSPCEILRLNDTMKNHDTQSTNVPTLTEHFSPGWIAERNRCNEYSNIVRNRFTTLMDNNQASTIDSISSSLNPMNSTEIKYPELKPMASLIGDFVLTLKEKNLLPCIVFTHSRALCEELADSLSYYFEEIEAKLRQTKYKKQIDALTKRLEQIGRSQQKAKEKAKKVTKSSSSKRRGSDDEGDNNEKPADLQKMEEEDQSQLRLSGYEQDLLDGILEEATLANRRTCDREVVDRLIERATSSNERLARYIKRGIAFHHAQLKGKSRVAVEGLFRNRYVQIVFSTWTLALGIHMPTKTVAFVKDSIELDALQYRQSSGRAGRRGFDVQGNVVFIDIPMSKIRHLTIAAIPDIQTYTISTSITFPMRLLYLYTNAEDKKDALNRSLIALQCPFSGQTSITNHLIDAQTRFHLLHTLEFLYRLNFINNRGELVGLGGLLMQLHNVEPANVLFAHLIDTRLFHQLNNEEEIINLLASIFTNRPRLKIRQANNSAPSMKDKVLFNSKHSLRSIPSEIYHRIETYNALVKQIFGSYIENVTRKMRLFQDNQEFILPYSNISFSQPSDYENGSFEYELHHHYSQQTQNPSISPFAGPSGLTHEQLMSKYNPTTSSWDLAYNLDLSTRIIPFIDIDARDHTNSSYHLNSYILDFFKHGSEALIMSENGLDPSETHPLLSKFFRSLIITHESLDKIIEDEKKRITNKDMRFFAVLGNTFESLQNSFWAKYKHTFDL